MTINYLNFRYIGLLAVFFLLVGSLQAQSKLDALFNKLGENKKMTVVNISKEMMSTLADNVNPMQEQLLHSTLYPGEARLTDHIGPMRVISSKELTLDEQTNYNKMITECLNDGYKDLMNISTMDGGKPTEARMCIKPIDKGNFSEFIIYVREGSELSLLIIRGEFITYHIMNLTKLANLKGILNETMKLKSL